MVSRTSYIPVTENCNFLKKAGLSVWETTSLNVDILFIFGVHIYSDLCLYGTKIIIKNIKDCPFLTFSPSKKNKSLNRLPFHFPLGVLLNKYEQQFSCNKHVDIIFFVMNWLVYKLRFQKVCNVEHKHDTCSILLAYRSE